jgi:AraC family transcriptional regulator
MIQIRAKFALWANCSWARSEGKLHPEATRRIESDEPLFGRSVMSTSEGYGQRLAERLRAEHAPAVVTQVLPTADIAVTETRCDEPVSGLSGSLQREDAFLVTVTVRDYLNRVYWEDERLVSVCDVRTGQTCIHDLKHNPVALLDKPYHVLFFYLPRGALDAVADDADALQIGDLNHESEGFDDPTVCSLAGAMLPALSHSERANHLFVDHVLLAAGVHVAQAYGGMRALARPARGGLAPWQVRKFSAPTLMVVCSSTRWLGSTACR